MVVVVIGGGVVVVAVVVGVAGDEVVWAVVVAVVVLDVVGVGVDPGPCMSSRTPKMISPTSTAMSTPIPSNPKGLRQAGTASGSGSAPLLPA
jgi:hypothetical protein